MKFLPRLASLKVQHARQEFATSEEYLSYELTQAIKALPPLYTHIVAGSLSCLVVVVISWAAWSQVDEVASADGELIPSQAVQPVQASLTGEIRQIHVTEGKKVKKGDPLVSLNSDLSDAEVKKQVAVMQEEEQRLLGLQKSLGGARVSLSSAIQQKDELQKVYSATSDRISNAQEAVDRIGNLAKVGGQSRLEFERERDKVLDLRSQAANIQSQIAGASRVIQDAQDKIANLETNIAEQQQKITQVRETYKQALQQREKQTIRAPQDGEVYNLRVTQGQGFISASQELLSIAPAGTEIILKTNVSNKDIGFIKEGMRVKVKFDTFHFQEFGTIEGQVTYIAPNAVLENSNNKVAPVFPVNIRLTKNEMQVRGKTVQFRPGMTVKAEIVTRQRSILSILTEPIFEQWSEAFSGR